MLVEKYGEQFFYGKIFLRQKTHFLRQNLFTKNAKKISLRHNLFYAKNAFFMPKNFFLRQKAFFTPKLFYAKMFLRQSLPSFDGRFRPFSRTKKNKKSRAHLKNGVIIIMTHNTNICLGPNGIKATEDILSQQAASRVSKLSIMSQRISFSSSDSDSDENDEMWRDQIREQIKKE